MTTVARHAGWHHLRYVGDRAACARYLPQGRKVLAFAMEQAAYNELKTFIHRMPIMEGDEQIGELVGEVVAGQPRLTINVATRAPVPRPTKLVKNDFVVIPRDESQPNSIDPDHPQLILAPAWTTFFYDEEIPAYAAFTGDKGTYRAQFREGLVHAGNVDWVNDDGVRLSWYGPQTRCFFDPYTQPRAQYGKFVFAAGEPLLDVDQYIIDSDPEPEFAARWVMGAALSGLFLIVVHAELPIGTTPDGAIPANTSEISPPWPRGPINVEVCRYSLIADADRQFGSRVVPRSRVVLTSAALDDVFNPWFFSASGEKAITQAMPANTIVELERFSGPFSVTITAPAATTQNVHRLGRDELTGDWEIVTTTVSLSAAPSTAALTTDYKGNDEVTMMVTRTPQTPLGPPPNVPGDAFSIQLAGADLNLHTNVFEPAGPDNGDRPSWNVVFRHLLYADLRVGVILCARFERKLRLNATPFPGPCAMELWRDGVRIYEEGITYEATTPHGLNRTTGGLYIDSAWQYTNGADLAPLFAIYGGYLVTNRSGASYGYGGLDMHGKHAGYSYLYSQKANVFGSLQVNIAPINATAKFEDGLELGDVRFDLDAVDVHGYASAVGCATSDIVTLVSCWRYYRRTGDFPDTGPGRSHTWVAGTVGEFPEITGVGGTNRRYHPIWLLGAMPQAAT